MVSWNLPARLAGRKISLESSDGSSQQDNVQSIDKATSMKKIFRFDLSKSIIYPHYCLEDLSDEEFRNMWITDEEFMAFKKEYVTIVRMMMKTIGEFPETENCCPRGLGTLPLSLSLPWLVY